MKSIFENICNNIQENGKLNPRFDINKYIEDEDILGFEPGTLDGIARYHMQEKEDKRFKNYIIKILKSTDEENIQEQAEIITEYIIKNKKRAYPTIHTISSWIINNADSINFSAIVKLGIYLAITSTNVEAVKIGISIIGLADISENKGLIEILTKLALCEEFTLYSIMSLELLENENDIKFMLVKKVEGWGKIHLINSIDITNETIKEWLIINGCQNTINLGYTAQALAQKLDILEVLKRENLTEEEFTGISNIMRGLFDEGPFIRIYDDSVYSELMRRYLKHFDKFINSLEFYDVLILFSIFIFEKQEKSEEDIKIATQISDLMDSEEVTETLRESILNNEDLYKVVSIIKYNNQINLYSEIFEKYKENPFNYCYCLEYLLQNDIFKDRTMKILKDDIDLHEYYCEPESILGINNKYSKNLSTIIQILREYPLTGNEFIIAGLKSKYMYPRKFAISTIEIWRDKLHKDISKFPKEIYDEIVVLQKKEVIKVYRIKLNEILKIEEDLSDYIEPEVIWDEKVEDSDIDLDLFDEKLDELFKSQIKARGRDYYYNQMVYSCSETTNNYIAFVQGTGFGKEYEVKIEKNKQGRVKSMSCNCPYFDNCKHEYATILYLRNKQK